MGGRQETDTGLSRIKPSMYKTLLESSDPRQDMQGVLQKVLAFTELWQCVLQ